MRVMHRGERLRVVGKGRRLKGSEPETVTAVQRPNRVVQIAAVLTRNTLFIALSSKNMKDKYVR